MTTVQQGIAHPMIGYLNGLVERGDRGALAALRRGLGRAPWGSPEMYPHVMRFNPPPWAEDDYFLVASLFAFWHQGRTFSARGRVPDNVGASFREVANQRSSESVERRFVALLNAHRQDLPDHLRHAIALMRSAERPVPVNWNQLLIDLGRWNSERRTVQRRWARGFWGQTSRLESDEDNASAAADEEGDD